MILSKETIKNIEAQPGLVIPDEKLFSLPEKVLQFGTGVLLRGLPDYFIDKANRQEIFNGRIVVVKSTGGGKTDAFDQQDGLYTLCVRGIENGVKQQETIINSSISRVISAVENWAEVLACANDPNLQIVISNTTEVGITLIEDDIRLNPPHSFPGKLLAFLYERYHAFNGSSDSGLVIVPTELIPDNAIQLRSILIELAKRNKLDEQFIHWLETTNHFCNSLVDRIVPGRLPEKDKQITEKQLGYKDELMIMSESFRLWAIESDNEKVSELLSFSKADAGVTIAPDIEKFRILKLRLLNATHSFACGLAHLSNFNTVKETITDNLFGSFIHNLMIHEIAKTIVSESISIEEACTFADKVMDRFRNPYIEHRWLSISVQYSSKMKMRTVPLLTQYYGKTKRVPELMALGFAGYLLFMKCHGNKKGGYSGIFNGKEYTVQDDHAAYFADKWKLGNTDEVVDAVVADKNFWDADLSQLHGFSERVKFYIHSLMEKGAMATIRELQKIKV
ncbi:MAG TPA: tagaturonate reductase [Chitinophagaceae bacterium]|nr:tagaturonate reductase [Chitinophagaceae bacterium]